MSKRTQIVFIIASVLVLLSIFSFLQTPSQFKSPTPSASQSSQPSQSEEAQSSNANITVTQPTKNQSIGSKFRIIGKARVFENVFAFRLKNEKSNKIYAETSTMTDDGEMGQFGNFNFEISFEKNATDLIDGAKLILEVYQHFPKDGAEIDKVSIPLIYQEP